MLDCQKCPRHIDIHHSSEAIDRILDGWYFLLDASTGDGTHQRRTNFGTSISDQVQGRGNFVFENDITSVVCYGEVRGLCDRL